MSITDKDIRAAVAANVISEAQAANLLALADERRGFRARTPDFEEPFELFKGFNEIFIVIGLGILYAGWMAITGISAFGGETAAIFVLYGLLSLGVTVMLARYFTVKRRMVAPSIVLVVFTIFGGIQVGSGLISVMDLPSASSVAFVAAFTTLLLIGFYWMFRIPITLLFIALGTFTAIGALFVLGGAGVPEPEDLFRLSNEGPFAIITILLGLVALAGALWFDMSDPHRVTRRASSGFWLHVIAAPAIVNTIALTLFEMGGLFPQLLLLVFVALMAVFAIVIDRRSFLVAGVGYVVALAVVVLESGAGVAILALGLGLVLLGAKWEDLRGKIMNALPRFPGKDKLPPWGLADTAPEITE